MIDYAFDLLSFGYFFLIILLSLDLENTVKLSYVCC